MSKTTVVHLGVKIPIGMRMKLNEAVSRGDYLNTSDLVRTAIRKLLTEDK